MQMIAFNAELGEVRLDMVEAVEEGVGKCQQMRIRAQSAASCRPIQWDVERRMVIVDSAAKEREESSFSNIGDGVRKLVPMSAGSDRELA